jgi:hypothetical protein
MTAAALAEYSKEIRRSVERPAYIFMGAASHVVDLDRFKTCDQVPVCPIVNTRELRNYIFAGTA